MKHCPQCHNDKSLDEFNNDRAASDGKQGQCRNCQNTLKRSTRWANGTQKRKPFLERVWGSIQQCGHGFDCIFCCWPWTMGTDDDGYGFIILSNALKKPIKRVVTRIVYEIWNARPIPKGMHVAHRCDYPTCTNPLHLWLATPIENVQDCMSKNRNPKGETHGNRKNPQRMPRGEQHHGAKLTEQGVKDIRLKAKNGQTNKAIASEYGVTDTLISYVVQGKIWRHVE